MKGNVGPPGSATLGAQITLPLSSPSPGAHGWLCIGGAWGAGGQGPILTHIVSFEVPFTVTGLWEPNRDRQTVSLAGHIV